MELQVSTENEDEIRSGRTSTYEIDVDLAVPIIPLVTSTPLGPEADILSANRMQRDHWQLKV